MFLNFFYELKKSGIPVSVKEYLLFLEAVDAGIAGKQIGNFYYLSRASLVKDERHLDKFDRVFGHVFKGLESAIEGISADIPEEWLRRLGERHFTEEEKAQIQALGGWDKIMEELKKRLEEQKGRHQGGSKWIGTGGTSPYGAYGYNPEGVRIGQDGNRNFRAVKVWDRRDYKISTARWNLARATSSSRYAAYENSPAKALMTNSTSTTPSRARRIRAISTSRSGPSAATP